MASTISYANVAAKGTSSDAAKAAVPIAAAPSSASSIVTSSSTETVVEETTSSAVDVAVTATVDSEPSTASNSATSTTTSAGSTPNVSKKEKKTLAPAPVPLMSAWSTTSLASDSSVVDEHKWPTPDKTENQPTTKNNQQKFIKPITKQWLPMNAKVVLPSTRNTNQKQNRNRKNKNANGTTSKNASSNSPSSADSAANPKKQNGTNGSVKKDDVAVHEVAEEVTINGEESAVEIPDTAGDYDVNNINNQYQYQYNPQFQKFSQVNPNNQKNFRRFNNPTNNNNNTTTNSNGQFNNKRFNQQPQPHGLPQNGFYHPQPYVQNQNFQTFQSRPFRPQNGQFRPNNRNYRQQNNGYRNGGMVMAPPMGHFVPVALAGAQIPPPISPKQDPEQALTQQIDYYFSLENLLRDIFLRKNMDSEGWIALDLILNFKRVKIIINGIQNSLEKGVDSSIILESIKKCKNLEIQYINDKPAETAAIDDVKLRVKGNYEQWLLSSEN